MALEAHLKASHRATVPCNLRLAVLGWPHVGVVREAESGHDLRAVEREARQRGRMRSRRVSKRDKVRLDEFHMWVCEKL